VVCLSLILFASGVQSVLNLVQSKLGCTCDIFTFRDRSQEKMYTSWAFHVDEHSESSSTYDMINFRYHLRELGMITNFNDQTVTWDRGTVST
jgi:hypothetical protein